MPTRRDAAKGSGGCVAATEHRLDQNVPWRQQNAKKPAGKAGGQVLESPGAQNGNVRGRQSETGQIAAWFP
jgi:hypothetical protein